MAAPAAEAKVALVAVSVSSPVRVDRQQPLHSGHPKGRASSPRDHTLPRDRGWLALTDGCGRRSDLSLRSEMKPPVDVDVQWCINTALHNMLVCTMTADPSHFASLRSPPTSAVPVDPATALPTREELESKRRWTRDDWIAYALRVLEEGGVAAVRIDDMAKRSDRTRGSFYGHFKTRVELLDAMLATFEQLRVATTESTHRLQRERGAFTLSGLVEVLATRSRGELVFHANLELAVRLWARSDPRPRATLQRLDQFRLANACQMIAEEWPGFAAIPEVAVMFNAMLQGRSLLQIDPTEQPLADAVERMYPAFVALCQAAHHRSDTSPAPEPDENAPPAVVQPDAALRRRRRRSSS